MGVEEEGVEAVAGDEEVVEGEAGVVVVEAIVLNGAAIRETMSPNQVVTH